MYERIPNLPAAPGSVYDFIVERDVSGEDFVFKYTVMGKGEFPWDMLRHDMAYPADTVSAMRLQRSSEQDRHLLREVTLITIAHRKAWLPTFERWRSFGWFVKSTVHEEGR
jgi:hypothetical protein